MRSAFGAAGVLLAAISMTVPAFSAGEDNPATKRHTAPAAAAKKKAIQPLKRPTWDDCYAMSRQRGFDHEHDEWLQSIADCQEGKIPL
ncbi:MAG: hypothetical protein K2Z80_17060 [Xanthobacteraceae bacterium]|nr:hypothetical protein [Xanthobacteraceae bacterium]